MNSIFLAGTVVGDPVLESKVGCPPYLTLKLSVPHKLKDGIRHELFPINSWGSTALWGKTHIKCGMELTLRGRLAPKTTYANGDTTDVVAVIAEEYRLASAPTIVVNLSESSSSETSSASMTVPGEVGDVYPI